MSVTCPNCAAVYSDDLNACPKCGEGRFGWLALEPVAPRKPAPLVPELAAPLVPELPQPDPRGTRTPLRRRGRRRPFIIMGLAACLGLLCLVGWIAYRWANTWTNKSGPEDDWRDEARAVLVGGEPVDVEGLAPELRPTVNALGAAVRRQDGQAQARLYDIPRMIEEIGIPRRLRNEALEQNLRDGIIRGAAATPPELGWEEAEFRSIRRLPGGELVALLRIRHGPGLVTRRRLWLVKSGGGWKIYDIEELEVSIRVSVVTRALLKAGEEGGAVRSLPDIQATTQAMKDVAGQDLASARRRLAGITRPLPVPAMEAVRQIAHAVCDLDAGDFVGCLGRLDAAERNNPDMPAAWLLRARACNALARWRDAIKNVERFRALMGDDGDVCEMAGVAYSNVGEWDKAKAAYRRALDLEPDSVEALLNLALALSGDDDLAEIPARFAKLTDRPGAFDHICEELLRSGHRHAIRPLCNALRESHPGHARLGHYESLALAWERRPEQAAACFLLAQARLGEEGAAGRRKQFIDAMLLTHRPELGYEFADDRKEGYRRIASSIEANNRGGQSALALARMHARHHPDDPLLPWYRGAGHAWSGEFESAQHCFEVGMKGPPAPAEVLEDVLPARVRTLHDLGRMAEAYRAGAAEETFKLLSDLVGDDPDALAALADLHRGKHARSPDLLAIDCLLLAMRGKGEEALAQFPKAMGAGLEESRKGQFVRSFLMEMRGLGKAVEAYRVAPDAGLAFSVLAPPAGGGSPAWLPGLLEAHAKRCPSDPRLPAHRAALLTRAGDHAGAAALLDRAVTGPQGDSDDEDDSRGPVHAAIEALVRVGRVHRAIEVDGKPWFGVAHHLHAARRGPELFLLAALTRERGSDQAAAEFREGQAWLLMGRPDRALACLRRLAGLAGKNPGLTQSLATQIAIECKTEEALAALADSPDALLTIGRGLLHAKKAGEAFALAERHLEAHPDRWQAHLLLSEIHKERGDASRAGWHFAKLPAEAVEDTAHLSTWLAVARGEAAAHALANPHACSQLVHACESRRDGGQLHALAVLERRLRPEAGIALAWEAKALMLAGDHAGALRLIEANREAMFRPGRMWVTGGLLVRALVKAGRCEEAVKEASALARKRRIGHLDQMLARAAAGDVKGCMALAEDPDDWGGLVDSCYADPDLGPLLAGEAFAPFRARFPRGKSD